MDSRRAQSSDQVKIDWEKTFPEGFNSKVLAALWMPETARGQPPNAVRTGARGRSLPWARRMRACDLQRPPL